jgi:hypothetical protein
VRRHIPDSDEAFLNNSTNILGFPTFVGCFGSRHATGGYPAVLSFWGKIGIRIFEYTVFMGRFGHFLGWAAPVWGVLYHTAWRARHTITVLGLVCVWFPSCVCFPCLLVTVCLRGVIIMLLWRVRHDPCHFRLQNGFSGLSGFGFWDPCFRHVLVLVFGRQNSIRTALHPQD